MAQIRVEALNKSFGTFHAVKTASFTVEDGQFLCLLGPSGCGKTTTLRMIAGLELPTAGTIRLGGEDVTMNRASARDIAFVFQLFALYPHLNVRRNIGFPLQCEGIGAAERERRVVEAARILRISHLLDRSVSGLAGGDRQRVALGRAIVRKPKCFLMDEPLGALDTEMREAMIRELRALHDRLGATTVYVTHDQLEAMAMADRIAAPTLPRESSITANVAPEIAQTPAASPSRPSRKLTMFITATIPNTVKGAPTHSGSTCTPTSGNVNECTHTPNPVGITAAVTCPTSFCHHESPRKSSIAPTVVATAAPSRIPRSSPPSGTNASDGTSTPRKMARPPRRSLLAR